MDLPSDSSESKEPVLQYQNLSKVLANSLILDVVALLQLRHLTRVPLPPPPSSPFSSPLVLVGIERQFYFLVLRCLEVARAGSCWD